MQRWKKVSNHYLLWHGSSTANFIGILSEGLRLPMHSGLCGKGVYFADMCSKSYGYCSQEKSPDGKGGETSILLLCEVALGKMFEVDTVERLDMVSELDKPIDGFNSTKALGISGPDFVDSIVFPSGVMVPLGPEATYQLPERFHEKKRRIPSLSRSTLQNLGLESLLSEEILVMAQMRTKKKKKKWKRKRWMGVRGATAFSH